MVKDCRKLAAGGVSRRAIITAAAAAGLAYAGPARQVLAALLGPTPGQGRGPFYPREKPLDQDNDLARVAGRSGLAEGRLLHVAGRVLDASGAPVAGARVEIWQANSFGRYHHPGDGRDVPIDENFQGFGHDMTDAAGAYRFRTIEPAPYPASNSWMRPPHIHFAVSAPSRAPLVTQMYFSGNEWNEGDYLLNSIADEQARERLIVPLEAPTPDTGIETEPGAALAQFDIVLGPA